MKKLFLVILICILLVGCVDLSMPESTIKPPTIQRSYESETEKSINVPEGMVLFDRTISYNSFNDRKFEMKMVDVNQDGESEMLAFYGLPHKQMCKGAMLLKQINYEWEVFWESEIIKFNDYSIIDYQLLDLNGDGILELILEVGYINSPKMINIYSISGTPQMLYTIESNRVEVIYNESMNPTLAIWLNVTQDTYYIELIRWEEDAFVLATYNHPEYYQKLIPTYKKNTENEDIPITQYYYADILMKAGEYELGYDVINDFLSKVNEISSIYKMKGNFVKAKCAYGLGDIEKAEEAALKAIEKSNFYIDKLLEAKILLSDIYIAKGLNYAAKEVLKYNQQYISYFKETDYKYQMWLNIFEEKLAQLN